MFSLPSQNFGTYASSEEPNIVEKSRKNSSSSQTSLQDFKNSKKEFDPEVLERRQKQIDCVKNTLAYQNYIRQIPKKERPNHLPRTPKKTLKYSQQWVSNRRAWKRSIQLWNNDRDETNKVNNNLVPELIESCENFRNTSPIDVINIDETVLELSENETEKCQAVTTTEKIKAVSKKQKRVVSKNKKLNKKNYFGLSITKEAASKEKVFEDVTTLMNEKEYDVKDSPNLAYFSRNEKDLESLVGLEIENSATNGNIQEIGANLYQWAANKSGLKSHLENQVGHLTEFHVNLAASNGYETWKWACSTYAKQLEEKGHVVKASSYFLMVRFIHIFYSCLG